MTGPLPPASLVIPSANRSQLLAETVESVLAGSEVPAEILILDQSASRDLALEALRSPRCQLRYVWRREPGVSRARNAGVRLARHAWLAFLDDDIRVHSDWFACLLAAAVEAGPRSVITGRVLPEQPATKDGFVPSTITDEQRIEYRGRIGLDILYSNNMMLHRSAFEEVGGFDERLGGGARFPTAEDNDLAHRLLEAGYTIIYAPEPTVVHRAWRSGRDYLPLRWRYARGQGAFYAKNLDLHDRYILRRAVHDLTHNSRRFFRFLRREPRRATGQLVHVAGVASAMAQWLLTRPRVS